MIINYDINNKGGGGASAEGCLRYDQEQDLTAEQQAQAKENLGIEEPEPQVYEVSSLDDIPAETANQIYADYVGGKTVLVKLYTLIGLVNNYSVVSAKSENNYNYITLSGGSIMHELKSAKIPRHGELATLTSTTIPTVNNPTVTINQGGTTKGSFTLNQSGEATINLDSGSGGSFSFEDLGFAPYDSEGFYHVGDVVIYQGSLQRFVADPEITPLADCLEPVTVEQLIGEAGLSFEELGFKLFNSRRDYHKGDVVIRKDYTTDAEVLMVALDDMPYGPFDPANFAETSVAELIKNIGGSASAEGCIRYDQEQDLTDEQQEQARNNIGAAVLETHRLLREELWEPMGCSANTWHTLAELTVYEDGVYQVSASARMLPADQSTAFKTATVSIERGTDANGYQEVMEITLPRSGEYGTLSVPVCAEADQKLRLRAISEANFYAQASPQEGKASATFIAAVRVGDILPE